MGNSIPCNCNFEVAECIKIFELDKAIRFCLCPRGDGDNLIQEMNDLRQMKDDVNDVVIYQQQTQPKTECNVNVRRWMQRVEELNMEVTRLLNPVEERSCLFRYNYKLGKGVDMMLERVQRLVTETKDFPDILVNPKLIEDVPYPIPIFTIKREKTLSEIVCHLEDVNTKIVGIFGMGGVGKTTILKQIKREMMKNERHDFELVVWITVSRDVNVTSIQDQIIKQLPQGGRQEDKQRAQIAKQLQISLPSQGGRQDDERQRAQTLHDALMNKRSLLLMDDIWEFLNLERIGIPIPTIDCDTIKIAFTTRDEQICIDMGSQRRICVKTLNEEDSLELFRKVSDSEEILQDARFLNYAKQIVKKCDGLPLAIITIGRALANQKKINHWDNMISLLNDSFHKIHGANNMLKVLKVSFDKLENDTLRSCLLYCCLYPENDEIYIEDLINQWVAEGLVEFQSEGHYVINKLKSACLLESGGYSDVHVTMHDVVREMALWLTNNSNDPGNYFKVYDTSTASNLHSYDGWDKAKRISLMRCELESLPDSEFLYCPNLVTLLLNQNDRFYEFSTVNFFMSMPLLCYLDLSCTGLREIPRSIKFLVNLQYLNLCMTEIECLPMEVSSLKKLKTLNLEYTYFLQWIPKRAIVKLVNLRALNMKDSGYDWKSVANKVNRRRTWCPMCEQPQLMFKHLEKLKHLDDLAIEVNLQSHFKVLVNNPTLSAAITRVTLTDFDCNDDDLMSAISKFSKLRDLSIHICSNLRELVFFGTQPLLLGRLLLSDLSILSIIVRDSGIMQNLSVVIIERCSMLKDVMWTAKLPNLKDLSLFACDEMKTLVVGDDEAREERPTRISYYEEDKKEHQNCYYQKLVRLGLEHLQSLESISKLKFPLLFPSLKRIFVQNCPKLEDICLGCDSAKDMKYIYGEQEWWNGLKWQDEDAMSNFLPCFEPRE